MIYVADHAYWEDNQKSYMMLFTAEYSGLKDELARNFEMGVSNKNIWVSQDEPYWEGMILLWNLW